jgi:hypothetical protein
MSSIPDWLGYLDTPSLPSDEADYAFKSGDRISVPLPTHTGYSLTLRQRQQVLQRLRQQDMALVVLLRQHITMDVLNQFALGLLARWWSIPITPNTLDKNWVGWSVAHLLSINGVAPLIEQLQHANLLYALHAMSALTQMQSPIAQFYVLKYWLGQVRPTPELGWLHQYFTQIYHSIYQASNACLPYLTLPYLELHHAGQTYTVALAKDLTLRLHTPTGDTLDAPPANADARMMAEWQACTQLIDAVRFVQQRLLEAAMLEDARWTVAEFKCLYWQHPLTRYLAQTLIWGVYQGNKLRATFRLTPELTLSNSRDRDYRLPRTPNTQVGVVHPRQLSLRAARQWRSILFDYAILQPFEQLALTPPKPERRHLLQAMDNP